MLLIIPISSFILYSMYDLFKTNYNEKTSTSRVSLHKKRLNTFYLTNSKWVIWLHYSSNNCMKSWDKDTKTQRAFYIWRKLAPWPTHPGEQVIPCLLADGLDLWCLFTVRLFSIHLTIGDLVARDYCVIGWGMPCHVERIHPRFNFELGWSKDHWKVLEH